jgi:cyclophilin family peptidyl-prolyl cis-trans isomerase
MSKKIILFTLCATFFISACGSEKDLSDKSDNVIFCTEDAKVCADGSTVSRIPPKCEFAPCSLNISTMPTKKITVSDIPVHDCDAKSDKQKRCAITGDAVVKITTNKGEIWLRLTADKTPKTVENFIGLSERGFYDNLIFHRVIPDFMIQGGDPLGNGTGGESIWGAEFEDEFTSDLKNIRGSIAMANRGPATNTSQFFINQADNSFLDNRHTVFGQVLSGLDIVDEIMSVERDGMDKPLTDVVMEQVEVFEVQ